MSPAHPRRRRGFRLFFLLFLFAFVAALYSGYWAYARNQLWQGIEGWVAAERARGSTVEFSDMRLGGYPFRFALTVADPAYGEPGGPIWSGQQLQLVMQPWNWQHVIARSPGRNTYDLGAANGPLTAVLGPRSAASFSWTEEGLRRVSLALDEAALGAGGEPLGEIDRFEFHLRPAPDMADMLQLETHFQAVRLPPMPELAALGQEIGPSILRLEAERGMTALATSATFADFIDTVLDLGGEIHVPQLMVEWGPADLGARARLSRSAAGEVRGEVGLRLDDGAALRDALAEAGQLDPETARYIELVEAASVEGGFLVLTLRADGLYLLGQRVIDMPLGRML